MIVEKKPCNRFQAVRENMDIQNRNDELQKEIARLSKEIAEKILLQKQCEKWVVEIESWIRGEKFSVSIKNQNISSLHKQQQEMTEKNKKLQKKLEEILPESLKTREGI